MQHLQRDFTERGSSVAVKSGSRESPGYGQRSAVSRPMAVAHKENGGISLPAKGKEKGICEKKFIYRNGKAA